MQQKKLLLKLSPLRSELGDEIQRLTLIEDAPDIQPINLESFREKELITIVLSYQNWIRSHKGHLDKNTDFRYRDGDKENFIIHAQSTDKILFFTERGYFYTLNADRLPSGRGVGEPLTKLFDLNDNEKIISVFPFFSG